MLLLSRGLVLSFRDLLDRAGFDIRVLATRRAAVLRAAIADATALSPRDRPAARRSRPCCSCACDAGRSWDARHGTPAAAAAASRLGATTGGVHRRRHRRPVDVDDGVGQRTAARRRPRAGALVVNRNVGALVGRVTWRSRRAALRCGDGNAIAAGRVRRSPGWPTFRSTTPGARTAAGTPRDAATLCGGRIRDQGAEMLLVRRARARARARRRRDPARAARSCTW